MGVPPRGVTERDFIPGRAAAGAGAAKDSSRSATFGRDKPMRSMTTVGWEYSMPHAGEVNTASPAWRNQSRSKDTSPAGRDQSRSNDTSPAERKTPPPRLRDAT
eukprot:1195566-Prorocentrum_minimum.AAC.1